MGISLEVQFKMAVGFGGGECGALFTRAQHYLAQSYLVSSERSVALNVTKIGRAVFSPYPHF